MLNQLEEFLGNLERLFLLSAFTSEWKLLPAGEAEIFFHYQILTGTTFDMSVIVASHSL